MTRRSKLISILVLLLLFIIIVIILVILALRGDKKEQPLPQPVPVPVEQRETTNTQTPTPTQQIEQENRVRTSSVQTIASLFAERYGSFSTESNFQNLRDVMPLMTANFAAETERQIATTTLGDDFYGVTTRVQSFVNVQQNEELGTAVVTMETQREEAKGSTQNISVRYQEITVSFVQDDSGAWKVSGAEWK